MEYIIALLILFHLFSIYLTAQFLLPRLCLSELKQHWLIAVLLFTIVPILAPILVTIYILDILITKGFPWR